MVTDCLDSKISIILNNFSMAIYKMHRNSEKVESSDCKLPDPSLKFIENADQMLAFGFCKIKPEDAKRKEVTCKYLVRLDMLSNDMLGHGHVKRVLAIQVIGIYSVLFLFGSERLVL